LVLWFQCRDALNVQTNLTKNEQILGIKHALVAVMLQQLVKLCENVVQLPLPLIRVHIPMSILLIKQKVLANKKNKKEVDNEESL
jgi:hypothetical protein